MSANKMTTEEKRQFVARMKANEQFKSVIAENTQKINAVTGVTVPIEYDPAQLPVGLTPEKLLMYVRFIISTGYRKFGLSSAKLDSLEAAIVTDMEFELAKKFASEHNLL